MTDPFLNIGDLVRNKKGGRTGVVVPIPHDYGHAPGDDPFLQARLVYVYFYDIDEIVLVPESRVEEIS